MMLDWLFPWRRFASFVRELDRAERRGVAEMQQELWRTQAEEALRRFYEPTVFARLTKG